MSQELSSYNWDLDNGRGRKYVNGEQRITTFEYRVAPFGTEPLNVKPKHLADIAKRLLDAINKRRRDEKLEFASTFSEEEMDLQVLPDGTKARIRRDLVVITYGGVPVYRDLAVRLAGDIEANSMSAKSESAYAAIRSNPDFIKIMDEEKL